MEYGEKKEECCATCRFWKATSCVADDGICRRYPPIQNRYDNTPNTDSDYWCGEFRDKKCPAPSVEHILLAQHLQFRQDMALLLDRTQPRP